MKEKEIRERLKEPFKIKRNLYNIDIYVTLKAEDTKKEFMINCHTMRAWEKRYGKTN